MAQLGELLAQVVRAHLRDRTGEVRRGEVDEGHGATGEHGEAVCKTPQGLRRLGADDGDVGRAQLKDEPQERLGRGVRGELSETAHLPGVEDDMADGRLRRVDEEQARVTAWGVTFEHRGWSE